MFNRKMLISITTQEYFLTILNVIGAKRIHIITLLTRNNNHE